MIVDGTVRVAAVQMDVVWMEPETNVARVVDLIVDAAGQGAKLVVFPELVTSGYLVGRNREFMRRYRRVALTIGDPLLQRIAQAAIENECTVVVGFLKAHPVISATFCNSVLVAGPDGIIGTYDKMHIPSEEKHYFHPGSSWGVFDTPIGRIGTLICADNSFPESARTLALKGAEFIAVSYNVPVFPVQGAYRSLAVARAFENQLAVIAANRVGAEDWDGRRTEFEGGSSIVAANGELLASADHREEIILVADLDFDTMADARMWQTRYRDRRPETYGALIEPNVPMAGDR